MQGHLLDSVKWVLVILKCSQISSSTVKLGKFSLVKIKCYTVVGGSKCVTVTRGTFCPIGSSVWQSCQNVAVSIAEHKRITTQRILQSFFKLFGTLEY